MTAPVALDAAIEEAKKALAHHNAACDALECMCSCIAALEDLLSALSADRRLEEAEAAREAVLALLSEPGDLEYPVEDVYSEGPDVDGNGDAPFWSEAGLYGRVGKEAARTLLARHRRATEALAALSTPAHAPSAPAMRRCEAEP